MSGDPYMSDDDLPLAASSPAKGAAVNGNINGKHNMNGDVDMDDDDDIPLSQATNNSSNVVPPRQNLKRKKVVASDDSSEDDTPLASSPPKQSTSAAIYMPGAADTTTAPASRAKRNSTSKRNAIKEESSDNDEDAASKKATKKPPRKKVKNEDPDEAPSKPARKRKVKIESDAEPSEDDKPISKKAAKKAPVKKAKKEDVSDSETPKTKKRAPKAKKEQEEEVASSPTKGKGKKKNEEEEQEDIYRWWDNNNEDSSVKWTTLEHNGVIFPPPYEPLPSNVKMKYDGKVLDLPPESEEVAGFYAALIETDHAQDATFNKNFFEDWKKVLQDHPPRNSIKVTDFNKCDFRPMYEYFEAEKAKKKAMSAAEKKEVKKQKDEAEAKYTHCLLDGRKEKVGNFRVEPPGLFRGRGEHPKKGSLKYRVYPEDITLNIGKEAPIPIPNIPGKWKAIQHDNTVTWLATWTENINQSHKYVFLAAGSSLKGQSDMAKFEKARELKNHVDRIRQNYTVDLKSKVMAERQRATAMYFIDKLALRAGNEKGEDEADTVGCCSLRCEHVTLEPPNFVVFDFLGKDSIRYYNRVAIDTQVFKNIKIFKENKNDDDNLFDRVNTAMLNKHLNSEMKGLTAKVFRTYNASHTFQTLLDESHLEGVTLQEKLNAYNKANRLVAILCNHQRSVPKTHDQSMQKMAYKYKALKYDRLKLRHQLFSLDSKYKKNEKYKEDESDIDDDWIVEHEEQMKVTAIEKAEKKFAKDNEKLVEEGSKPNPDSILKEKIEAIEEEFKQLAKERGKTKVAVKSNKTPEKVVEQIDKLSDKIKTFKLQMVDRDEGKEVALGTSKINYLDPRITAAWCKIHSVPIEKLFSKTLQVKFPWAMEVDEDWKF
ncbi:topoisomerase i [Moniliophthora roreri MCA 2997]|uniref:DNA topoisomerase I n=1 Tax=Moniliophthora roreri (strain MCA 2997) TaxID=1381753 RepID=V2XTI4_MONRO|nr:topoisomerase i [Moniliophthora roreri MCA 2997]